MIGGSGLAWPAVGLAILLAGRPGGGARLAGLTERGRLAGPSDSRVIRIPRRGSPPEARMSGALGIGATVGCASCGWALGGVVLAVPFALVVITGYGLVRGAVAAGARRRATAELLRAVAVIAGELSSGAGPAAALGAAAELDGADAPIFAEASVAAGRGGEASGVLLSARPAVQVIGHAWRIGESSGAPLATVLDRVAIDLAAEVEQRRAVSVALAGPRSSAVLLAGLPLLGVGLGISMGADPLQFLTGTPIGRAVCALGVVLDLAGIAWMARILRRAERA